MKPKSQFQKVFVAMVLLSLLLTAPLVRGQNLADQIEVVRSAVKTDRRVVIAQTMDFTEKESAAFWPIYRAYRLEMDKVVDGQVELVLDYADLYPNLPEERAQAMLKKYMELEDKAGDVRGKYLKKFSKVLPATKVLRFAQLENRLDLAVHAEIAARIPLVPDGKK